MTIKIKNISYKTTTEEFLKFKNQTKTKKQNPKVFAFGEQIINFTAKSRDRFSL